jgi:hypothetical protein
MKIHLSLPMPFIIHFWISLGLSTTLDAFIAVTTFNLDVIEHCHYFVTIRMMALAIYRFFYGISPR